MTTFERRQRILGLLREEPGIRVSQLARRLGVSEGTIRNDLSALEDSGQLTRVHGGAVLKDSPRFVSSSFAARVHVNADAKQWIAREAAKTIEDGESILVDASTTVFAMVPYLKECRNLTIVTNGIDVGLALAQNPSKTVILVGGVLRTDGTSVVGHLGQKILDDLHIKTAFVSCSGFSIEAGLTEVDIHEVQIKSEMIGSAERVVALVDSTKFGKVDLTSFASLQQISHVFTDSFLDLAFAEQLRHASTLLTVCGETEASTFQLGDDGMPPPSRRDHSPMGEGTVPALQGSRG
jgi:DeoR/GlpR family transcriptional regulator of sugar metabolism